MQVDGKMGKEYPRAYFVLGNSFTFASWLMLIPLRC